MTSTCTQHTGNNDKTWRAMAGWNLTVRTWSKQRHRLQTSTINSPLLSSLQTSITFFHIRQQFYHELRCNYKLCRAQLKVEDVRVSEQTSTAVCHRASRGWGRGVKWGLHDLRYVLTPSAEHKYVCLLVCLSLLCLFPGLLVMRLQECSTLLPHASFITDLATQAS